jgi:hypothetical protein
MVRRAFELTAQGSHATDVIRRTLGALGLRTRRGQEIPRQTFLSMLRTDDSRALTMRLQERTTLNQKLILAKLKGEVSQSDFDAVKPGIDKEIADIEAAKKALEMESSRMSSLIDAMRFKLENLVET